MGEHRTVFVPEVNDEIDEEMVALVLLLNRKYGETWVCCQGNPTEPIETCDDYWERFRVNSGNVACIFPNAESASEFFCTLVKKLNPLGLDVFGISTDFIPVWSPTELNPFKVPLQFKNEAIPEIVKLLS